MNQSCPCDCSIKREGKCKIREIDQIKLSSETPESKCPFYDNKILKPLR